MKKIALKVIGRVQNSVLKKKREGWERVISRILINPKYEEGLDGVEGYSHLFILFWLSRVPPMMREGMMKIHPKSRSDLPLVGIFSTRTQYRPNPIGLTLVRLLGRNGNILKVQGLDAIHGTPVIDIKPISPRGEFPRKTRVPEWYTRMWETHQGSHSSPGRVKRRVS